MNITKLVLGACNTNVYIVSSNKKNAILIDPADNAAEIIKTIEENGLCLKYIFITHGHTDHILALKEVKEYFNVPVIISKLMPDDLKTKNSLMKDLMLKYLIKL